MAGSAPARSAGEATGPAVAWTVISDPAPVTDRATPWSAKRAESRARSPSPRACSASAMSGVKASSSAATPARIVSALLLKVPACGTAPGAEGS